MARSRAFRVFIGLALAAGAVVTPVAFAASASAVSNLFVAVAFSDLSGSENHKQAVAVCPSGEQVLGGGGDITGGVHGVHLTYTQPRPSLEGVEAAADEDTRGYAGNWRLAAYAICAPPVRGRQIVSSGTIGGSGETDVSAHVTCPAGKKVIGAFGGIGGTSVHFVLDDVMPDFDLSGVGSEIQHDGTPVDFDENGSAFVFAVCVDPLPAQQLAFQASSASTGDKGVSVACPSGTKAHGAGAGLSGALGEAHLDRFAPSGLNGFGGVDVDARQDVDGSSTSWSAWAFAICAA